MDTQLDRPTPIMLHQDARGKVTARIKRDGAELIGQDYDQIGAIGRLIRDHGDRLGFAVQPIVVVEPAGCD